MLRFVLLIAFLELALGSVDEDLYVQVKNGVLRGTRMETRNGRKIHGFVGIPFAKPPLGELRFKPPVPIDNWKGVKDASKVHAMCPQRNIYIRSNEIWGEEDCLYLNVYKPSEIKTELLPVMFFIHGGGWLACSGNTNDYGPKFLLDQDVILVSVNYRLGALGFLSTEDEVVPGNNGMKDQALALKWTKENIIKFGGDPNKITIFGESAGGASVHLHMMSPLSKGLFQRGISQSGTALCPWVLYPKGIPSKTAKKLGELLGCPTETSQKLVECLRKVDATKIIAQDVKFMEWDTDPMIPFKPVIEPKHEGAFIDDHPVNYIKSGRIQDVPWMNGLNSDDGALRVAAFYGVPKLLEELNADFNRLVGISLEFRDFVADPDELAEKIRKFYFENVEKLDNNSRQTLVDLWTDGWFLNGADQATHLHKEHTSSPIYYYLFGYRGVASFTEIFGDKDNDYGVCHADELQYLFPVGEFLFRDKTMSESDKKMINTMTTLWTNFAKYGTPTPQIKGSDLVEWEPVRPNEDMNYMFIGDELKMKNGLLIERAKFWRELQLKTTLGLTRDEL